MRICFILVGEAHINLAVLLKKEMSQLLDSAHCSFIKFLIVDT